MTVRGEPTWQPISALPTIAMLIDEGLRDAREHYATLLEAQPKPYVLDDATIARVKRVNAAGLSGAGASATGARGRARRRSC